MRIAAPAKINIGLLVGGARSDGYHDIETIMACISLCDYIDITVRPADHTAVRISGNESYLTHSSADDGCKGSTKRADLMERAAFAFSERTGLRFSADISIEKHIPVKAGLGGGSSDAGAVFTFLNAFFGFPLSRDGLVSLASEVGSDIPFFVTGLSGAIVTGRGDVVRKADVPHECSLLLFIPGEGVSTALAYASLDSRRDSGRRLPSLSGVFPSRETHPNDFEREKEGNLPSFIPRSLIQCGAYISMTGSGSAWFALIPGKQEFVFDIPENCGIVSAHII